MWRLGRPVHMLIPSNQGWVVSRRYEGEFDSGFAHGMGQYTNTKTGKLYRGEYYAGLRHG